MDIARTLLELDPTGCARECERRASVVAARHLTDAMRIALLSTCAVAVPPASYGGTELITAELAKALVQLGHDVTVYATGDSTPAGTLRARFRHPVWPPDALAELRHAAFAWSDVMAADVMGGDVMAQRGRGFDVVHAHQAPALAFAAFFPIPTVLTLHHARDAALLDFYLDFPGIQHVAISRRQAELVPEMRVDDVVHHGLDPRLYDEGKGDGGFCLFLGRLAREKGPHHAIDAARIARVPLKIAGKPHWKDESYFDREVRPRLADARDVQWVGEVSHAPKVELLRGARALLFPIEWEEPFGLVMIEAMLVGTPVIAFARGSVPEVIDEGVTGFVVRDVDEMAARLRSIDGFDRASCRARAAERWSATRMAEQYVDVYQRAIRSRRRVSVRSVGDGRASDLFDRPSLEG
jgi:glycosyltransferase involved in cell wall biosynthesis